MERLIKPIDYAQKLGISRQAIYAKIKRGIFKAKSVDGKLYIVIEEKEQGLNTAQNESMESGNKQDAILSHRDSFAKEDIGTLMMAKDETIAILKDTIKDLKEGNRQMVATLQSEIDLLKEAFHEMRTLYLSQIGRLDHPKEYFAQRTIDAKIIDGEERDWVLLKDFYKKYQIVKPKKQEKLLKRLKKAYKKSDPRILMSDGEMKLDSSSLYEDILG